MKKLIFSLATLFLMTSVIANTSEFINSINTHIQSGSSDPMQITFDDGYQMNIGAPIELVEGPRVRCPCTVYTLRYTNTDTGAREERQIEDGLGGVKWKNGGDTFFVSSASAVTVDDNTDNPQVSENRCQMMGSYSMTFIHPRKIIESNGRDCPVNGTISCLGETIAKCEVNVKCENDPIHGTGEGIAYCMTTSGRCPASLYDCINDESLDNTIAELERYNMDLNESSNPFGSRSE